MKEYWQRMEELCAEKNISFFSALKRANVSFSSSYLMKSKGVSPTVKTLEKFCEALEITLRDFFDSSKFVSRTQSQSQLLYYWRDLSAQEKVAVEKVINEFEKIRLSRKKEI